MKNIFLTLIFLFISQTLWGQCDTTRITGSHYVPVGASTTLGNSNTGGTWSVSDTNVAFINISTGVITGKSTGAVTVTYNMPGACILFYSTLSFNITPGIAGPQNVSIADTATLHDSASTGGRWSSADTTIAKIDATSGRIMGIRKGVVLITCTISAGGHSISATRPVAVTSGIAGRRHLCIGDTSRLLDTVAGGTWQILDSNIAAIDSTSGLLFAKTAGNTIVTYTKIISGLVCHGTDSVWITRGWSGSKKICINDSTYFRDSVAGGRWWVNDTSIAVIDSATGLLRAISAGNARINYLISSARGYYFVTDTIQVAPVPGLPSISGPLAYCAGNSYRFPTMAASVMWTSDNYWLTPFDDGRYSDFHTRISGHTTPDSTKFRYTSSYCSYVHDSVKVKINPLPNPGVITGGWVTICNGDSVVLHETVSGGTWRNFFSAYSSLSSTGVLKGLPSIFYSVDVYPEYWVTNSYGCTDIASTGITINPRPSAGTITGAPTVHLGIIGNYGATSIGTADRWSITPTSIATISSTGQVTTMALGTATIKHVVSTSCGIDSVSRTITITPPAVGAATSLFTGFVNSFCSAPQFGVSTVSHTAAYKLKTYFGDGSFDSLTIPADSSTALSTYYHAYPNSGTYSIKQVLFNGSSRIDSVAFPYTHLTCNNVSLEFYKDLDHDCAYHDSTDFMNLNPIRVVIDSNGVTIDTIPATSGLYYREWGNAGDVYAYRIISSAVAMSCPASGVVYDTINTGTAVSKFKFIGLTCTSSGFDLAEHTTAITGRHRQDMAININNNYCAVEDGVVTMNFDSRFNFTYASPYPTSISGSTLSWNFTHISDVSGIRPNIYVHLEVPSSSWLSPGTPVYSTIAITPTTGGDLDTSNNVIVRADTVKSSWDPNMMLVSPSGNVLNGTKLHYTIEFENDGNDTAKNIFVMDTLSDALDLSSMELVMATARMNISYLTSGGHNIIKFDFPKINLPDSSHHLHCTGQVMFNIKTKRGLADGTHIYNHAGIFFDDNPVVMTDTSKNNILVPSLVISSTCRDTICHSGSIHCDAASTYIGTPHYEWYVNTTHLGADSTGFTRSTLVAGDSVKCIMTVVMDETVFTTSNVLHITERALPNPGIIAGATIVCPGASITLTDSITGGTWAVRNSHATISGGVITGVTAGLDTAVYTVRNICYPNSATFPFLVHVLPYAGTITGATAVCDTAFITLSDTIATGTWSVSNTHAAITAAGLLTGVSMGLDTVRYRYTNMCGADTAILPVRVEHNINPGVAVVPATVCIGSPVTVTDTVAGGSWSLSNSIATVSASGVLAGIFVGGDTVIYMLHNSCGTFSTGTPFYVSNVLPPAVSFTVNPMGAVCSGDTVLLSATPTYGGTAPLFYWERFGVNIGSGVNLTYNVSVGDVIICKMISNATCRTSDTVASSSLTLVVNPTVTPTVSIVSSPGDTVAYSGQEVTFYPTVTFGGTITTYQWYVNGIAEPGATSASYTRNIFTNDAIYCTVTGNPPCAATLTATSNTIHILADYLGVASTKGSFNDLKLYPNPNSGNFTIGGTLKNTTITEVAYEVRDVMNHLVHTATAPVTNGSIDTRVELQNKLAPGYYYIRLFAGNETGSLNFMINK